MLTPQGGSDALSYRGLHTIWTAVQKESCEHGSRVFWNLISPRKESLHG